MSIISEKPAVAPAQPAPFAAQIDGQTFLSKEEVDEYYDQQAMQEYESRGEG